MNVAPEVKWRKKREIPMGASLCQQQALKNATFPLVKLRKTFAVFWKESEQNGRWPLREAVPQAI